ncbi:MAG TPA: adenylate kinase [Candidatus Kapabacteria bacterium]|nr:adenylate kinase [Candidatus Kapabacteria bacterium]
MNLILFGPPGVGKGTQAAQLADAHNLLHISTGDILRAAIAEGSPLGRTAQTFVESGGLVPDDIIIGLVREVLERLTKEKKGFLLDGFPRTLEQARALDGLFRELNISKVTIVMLTAPEQELIDRMVRRGLEQGRKDDTAETIRHRLEVYYAQTEPVKAFYEKSRGVKLVDGLGTVEDVTARIERAL